MDKYKIMHRKYKSIEKISDFFTEKRRLNRCIPICIRPNTLTDTFGRKYNYSDGLFLFIDYTEKFK